jgi:hypothetical protein
LTASFGHTNFLLKLNEFSGKLTLTNSVNRFEMDLMNGLFDFRDTLGWIMGYRHKEYYGEFEYVTEGIYNSERFNFYFVVDEGIVGGSKDNETVIVLDNNYVSDYVLSKINLHDGVYGVTYNDGINAKLQARYYNTPVTIKRIRVRILDEYGIMIDLNRMDYTFSLEFGMLKMSRN